MSCDPMGFRRGDGNLYRYAGNRPTVAGDPSGLLQVGPGSVIGGVAVGTEAGVEAGAAAAAAAETGGIFLTLAPFLPAVALGFVVIIGVTVIGAAIAAVIAANQHRSLNLDPGLDPSWWPNPSPDVYDPYYDAALDCITLFNRGGSFGDLDRARGRMNYRKGKGLLVGKSFLCDPANLEVHHMPSQAYYMVAGYMISEADGPAIGMLKSDHRITRTWGPYATAQALQDVSLGYNPIDSQGADINDIFLKYSRGYMYSSYADAIWEMLVVGNQNPAFQLLLHQ
jgi:hypothetical protein